MLKQLEQVQRYRARYLMQDGTSVVAERATLDGIYGRIAWWLIVDRHGDLNWLNTLHGRSCQCITNPDDGTLDPHYCPLHNRKRGYFRRLHDRIVRWLKAGYIRPESDTIAN